MTMVAWISAFISVPLTFALDTARTVTAGGNAITLGVAVWLAGLLLVVARPGP